MAATLHASTSYTGYSGAPGSRGSCASTCHGNLGGTIVVEGFPETYQPGQTYEIWVRHTGGSSIRNFNASVRVGTGSETAGLIAAGYGTETYSRTQEPNGVHLSRSRRDSCSFNWTAPPGGTGPVRLYLAGLQGGESGNNTDLVLVADEATGIEEEGSPPILRIPSITAEPSVVASTILFRVVTADGAGGRVAIADMTGRVVAVLDIPPSAPAARSLSWNLVTPDGDPLNHGNYIAALCSGGELRSVLFTVCQD
jgi:hypothetical protein